MKDSKKSWARLPIEAPYLRQWLSTLKLVRKRKISLIGAIIVIAFLLISFIEGLLGYRILPYNPITYRTTPNLPPSILSSPPNLSHIFGTDPLGRDLFSQVVAALPLDAEVAFMVIISAVVIGVSLGIIAGYLGGRLNQIIMRITDVFIAFPGIILALAIAASLGPGLMHAMEALIVIWWPTYTRLARSEVLTVKSQLYVEASRAAGLSSFKIMLKHIAPNIIAPVLIYATLDIGNVILQTSVLSYLNLGAQAPTPELGRMVFDYQSELLSQPWLTLVPGIVIFAIVLGFNLLGDGLRDVLDPRLQRIISLPGDSKTEQEREVVKEESATPEDSGGITQNP
ncbi:MAG: ABC transporter permease [Nitrososphaerales archaeon]